MEFFQQDPRRDVHSRTTWRHMRPDCEFRIQLDLFRQGVSRSSLSSSFRNDIAVWRLASCFETLAEEKHARVAIQTRYHSIGSVGVSLSNRLVWLEKALLRGYTSTEELIEHFHESRNLKKCAYVFAFQNHPEMEQLLEKNRQAGSSETNSRKSFTDAISLICFIR